MNAAHEPLYAEASYGLWVRELYRRMPLPARARILFESTIDEPAALLSEVADRAFGRGMTDRFESVFGRGNPHLLAALTHRYGVGEAMVATTTGASNALAQAMRALLVPGAHVLIETPRFDVLAELARGVWAEVEDLSRTAPDFGLTADDLRIRLRPDTEMVVISNLHNPSGRWLTEAEILDLAAAAAEVGAWLLVDEVYADFARETPTRLASAPNLIRANSLSKVFGLHSLRCGWLIAEPHVIRRIVAANANLEFGVSKLAHAVAALVLEQPEPFEAHWRGVLAESRPVLVRHAEAMKADGLIRGGVPAFGCVYFPEIVGAPESRALAESLWRDEHLVTAPGELFGLAGHMRLGFGLPPAIVDEGLSHLHEALLRRQ